MSGKWNSDANDRRARRHEHRSLFWPVVLIGGGIVFLLDNAGAFPAGVSPWGLIARFWPAVLILIGLDLLFGRSGSAFGRLIGAALALGLVGAVIVLALASPPPPSSGAAWPTQTLTVPAAGVERATVKVAFGEFNGHVTPMRGGDNLLEADVVAASADDVRLDVRESGEATAVVIEPARGRSGVNWWDQLNPARWFGDDDRSEPPAWEVRLAEGVTFDTATFTVGSGAYNFDLARVHASALTIEGEDPQLMVRVSGALASGQIRMDDGAATLHLPEVGADTGVQVRVDLDDGSVESAYQGLERVREAGNGGVWETANYDGATRKLRIEVRADDATIRIE